MPPTTSGPPRRLAFLGTPDAAAVTLRALAAAGHDVALVVSRADKRRSRRGPLLPSPVKAAALELGLAVTANIDEVIDAGVDLGVVVAFGRIIKPHILERVPMVNVHFSLLPRWRGAAPVERAILAGDPETGICLMGVEEGLDTGPVYRRRVVEIGAEETLAELRERLVSVGTALLISALDEGLGDPVPQEGEAVYAAKIDPAELELHWDEPAVALGRVVRLGRAWTRWRGKRLLVLSATTVPDAVDLRPGQLDGEVVGTGRGGLKLVRVQPEGRAAMLAGDWLRGVRPQPDERLGHD